MEGPIGGRRTVILEPNGPKASKFLAEDLVEAEDDGEHEYGEERMLPVVQTLQSGTAAEALKRIMSSVDAFVGLTRQHDDITCLVLRMT